MHRCAQHRRSAGNACLLACQAACSPSGKNALALEHSIMHPNILRYHVSLTAALSAPQLWIVMPLMAKGLCVCVCASSGAGLIILGSVGDIIGSAHPDGFEEGIVAHITRVRPWRKTLLVYLPTTVSAGGSQGH